jgi:hypothetical protein
LFILHENEPCARDEYSIALLPARRLIITMGGSNTLVEVIGLIVLRSGQHLL